MIKQHTDLAILVTDDGSTIRTAVSREVFVSAKRQSKNAMEIVLNQLVFPHQDKFEHFTHVFNVHPHNTHLEKCLTW